MQHRNSKQLTIQQAIAGAKKAIKQGNETVAVELYKAVLQQQPNHPVAKKKLDKLQKEFSIHQSAEVQKTNPSQDQIDDLVKLYQKGELTNAELACGDLLASYPKSLAVINILAATLQGQGKWQEAIDNYNQAILLKPDFAEAYSNRGNALRQQGNLDKALESYDQAIQIKPDYAVAFFNRGNALCQQSKLEEALISYDKAIKLRPDFVEAYSNKGNALGELGKLDDALRSYDKAIKLRPDFVEVYSNRGNALGQLGKLDDALKSYDKLIQLKPDSAEAYSGRGNILEKLGQLDEALQSYNKAILLKPDFAEAYSNRGNILGLVGELDEALKSYDKAIKLKPDYAEAYSNYGSVLEKTGRFNEAIQSYDKAIELKPDLVEAYSNKGNVLGQLGKLDEALESYDKAILLRPDFVEAYSNRGKMLDEIGQVEGALKSYERAIQLKPDYTDAHRSLTTLKTYNPENPHIQVMEKLLSNSVLSKRDRMHLYFGLAKVYDDLGECEDSFGYLEKANSLRHQELNYNIDSDKRLFVRIKEVLNSNSLATIAASDSDTNIQPLFIIGMPRSGTSLVEQILASHSKVHGAGELETMATLAFPIIFGKPTEDFNQGNVTLSSEKIESLRTDYLKTLTSLNVRKSIFTDKMPSNFRFVGLILSAFPKSKIIHIKRDPVATCWSNYKHFFSVKGNGYAYDMVNLAEFYNLYSDLMAFWREQFPKRIYELDYEILTENQEEQSRKLLEFCKLEWEKQCLYFYKTKRAVRTASSAQVRQKMYKGSSEAWKKYESYLEPLINGLKR